MTAVQCSARIYVKSQVYRYRVDERRCTNRTTNASGRCWLHEGRTTDPERYPIKENKK